MFPVSASMKDRRSSRKETKTVWKASGRVASVALRLAKRLLIAPADAKGIADWGTRDFSSSSPLRFARSRERKRVYTATKANKRVGDCIVIAWKAVEWTLKDLTLGIVSNKIDNQFRSGRVDLICKVFEVTPESVSAATILTQKNPLVFG